MRFVFTRSLLLCILFTHPPTLFAQTSQTFRDAQAFYDQGNYQQAFDIWQQLTENGNLEAMYAIANLYQRGQGVVRDDEIASHWYRRAANLGHQSSQLSLGLLLLQQPDLAKDQTEVAELIHKSAKAGNPHAQYIYARMLKEGINTKTDPQQAHTWMLKSAENNHAKANLELGLAYLKGQLVEQNLKRAENHLNIAAREGEEAAIYQLALLQNQSDKEKMQTIRKAADVGYPQAQYDLARVYFDGDFDQQKNNSLATQWLTKAAENSFTQAQYELGISYFHGEKGLEKSVSQSLKWLKQAAQDNHTDAQYMLGYIYQFSPEQADADKSFTWYQKSAQRGNADAQYALANAYVNGLGTVPSLDKAVEWYYKAAEQDQTNALYMIGTFFENGDHGHTKNVGKASEYFCKAGELGHERGKFMCGSN